jgi:hypothetical protein
MSDQIEIRLHSKVDKNGDEYFIGSSDAPVSINLQDATFVFFLPPEDGDVGSLKIRARTPRRLTHGDSDGQ